MTDQRPVISPWRTDFENAPSPCIGWCTPPAGDDVRQIWRHPRDKNHWTAHSITQIVKAWQPMPSIEPQPVAVAQRPLAYRLDHPAMGIELSICEPDKDWVARGWIVTPLYASPAQSSWQPITDKMVKAGAAAMCCQAQTLGCAAKNKDSEFTTCMLPTFLEDARRCLSAALSSTDRGGK